jgi:hypothetical protein
MAQASKMGCTAGKRQSSSRQQANSLGSLKAGSANVGDEGFMAFVQKTIDVQRAQAHMASMA